MELSKEFNATIDNFRAFMDRFLSNYQEWEVGLWKISITYSDKYKTTTREVWQLVLKNPAENVIKGGGQLYL